MFRKLSLETRSLVEEERDLHVFLWRGSQVNEIFGAALAMDGLTAEVHDFGVTLPKTTAADGAALLSKLANIELLTPANVAAFVNNIRVGKFAEFIPKLLARAQWARQSARVVDEIPKIALGACQ